MPHWLQSSMCTVEYIPQVNITLDARHAPSHHPLAALADVGDWLPVSPLAGHSMLEVCKPACRSGGACRRPATRRRRRWARGVPCCMRSTPPPWGRSRSATTPSSGALSLYLEETLAQLGSGCSSYTFHCFQPSVKELRNLWSQNPSADTCETTSPVSYAEASSAAHEPWLVRAQ